ncbi:MAG: glycine--tRNA ligase subunit beta, partial [Parvibaculales bacterium]
MSGELLIEFYSEEIPARMQGQAELQFARTMESALQKGGIGFEKIQCFSTPRRLALCVSGIAKSVSRAGERKKGVRVDAPQKAIDGFLRSVGVSDVGKLETEKDERGEHYVVNIPAKTIKTAEMIAEIVPDIVRGFPWQKSMRWGGGSLSWVRPLRSILAVLDGKIVPFSIRGVASGNVTYGHPFLAPQAIKCADFKAYQQGLKKAFVVLEAGKRKEIIRKKAEALAAKKGLVADLDEALLSEIAALVESPHVLMGAIEKKYMNIPIEVSISVMRSHQKYIPLTDKKGRLAPFFLITANIADSGKMIVRGNERVLSARLADAQFFYDKDRQVSLEKRAGSLGNMVFYGKTSLAEKSEGVAKLARKLAGDIEIDGKKPSIDEKKIGRTCLLAKADLLSEMVGEFPDLQGVMGGYYARHDKESKEIAQAIAEQYKPIGKEGELPKSPMGIVLALAERFYILQFFWEQGKKPTSSKDPYKLRQTAIGLLRILFENW